MAGIKEKWAQILYKIRNPEYSEHEKEFKQQLNFKRLLFFIPFLIAVLLFWLLYAKNK